MSTPLQPPMNINPAGRDAHTSGPFATFMSMLLRHPLLRPLAALAILLLIDLATIPGFFHLEIKNGHLYGSLIDIVNRAAPLMLGMALMLLQLRAHAGDGVVKLVGRVCLPH